MRYRSCRVLTAGLLLAALSAPAFAQAEAGPQTPPEKAAALYETAMSQFKAGRFDQARPLLEEYVRVHPTTEQIPKAYLQLAYCCRHLKDTDGWSKALDQVIQRFYSSGTWFLASGEKLAEARITKNREAFLRELQKMLLRSREVPLDLRPIPDHYHTHGRSRQDLGEARGKGKAWPDDLLWAADTKPRAQLVLRLLQPTLRRVGVGLEPDWQIVHVLLLQRTEQAELADKTFEEYVTSWHGHPKGIALLEGYAEYLKGSGDEETAEPVLARIEEEFPDVQPAPAQKLLAEMQAAAETGDYGDFADLARRSLRDYGFVYQKSIVSTAMTLAKAAAERDASVVADAVKLLDEAYPDKYKAWRRAKAEQKVDLYLALGRAQPAVGAAEFFLGDDEWSPATLRRFEGWAKKHPPFEPLLAKAKEKYGIPNANPDSPAAELLEQLKTRLADDQVRHAEEIGEQLFTKHTKTAEAIEAVKRLVEYYFKQVAPEPRDRWVSRMVETYPRHPLTHSVLRTQATAAKAAQRGDVESQTWRLLSDRFPAAVSDDTRLQYLKGLTDEQRKSLYEQQYGPAGARGDGRSLGILAVRAEGVDGSSRKAKGDYWMEQAKRFAGTQVELECLQQARGQYWPGRGPVHVEGAQAVIQAMQKVQWHPRLQWQIEFDEVDLHSRTSDGQAALDAMNAMLKDDRKYRDLSDRVKFEQLGKALGKAKLVEEADALAERLNRVCLGVKDPREIKLMRAAARDAAGQNPEAGKLMLEVVREHPWPSLMHERFMQAAGLLRGSPEYPRAAEEYIRAIHNAQDLLPGVWFSLADFYMRHKHPAFRDAARTITSRYPASRARGRLDDLITKLREKARK